MPPPTVNGTNSERAVARTASQQGVPVFAGGGNVEQHDFVGAVAGVGRGAPRRIAGIAQILELHTFHDAASIHVEAGDDAFGQQSDLTEVLQNGESHVSRFLGMKLHSENVVALNCAGKLQSVFSGRRRRGNQRRVERMRVVNK